MKHGAEFREMGFSHLPMPASLAVSAVDLMRGTSNYESS